MLDLNIKKREFIDVKIGEKVYKIDLLSMLSVADVDSMRKVAKEGEDAEYEWGIKYIKRYIPEKIFNTLRMADVVAIFTELKAQSAKAGLDMGESKALQNS